MGKSKTNYTNMAKEMVAVAESKEKGYFEAIELPKLIVAAMKEGIEASKDSSGDIIFNAMLSGQYALKIKDKEFIIIDLTGNEYNFKSLEGAAVFAAASTAIRHKDAEALKYNCNNKLYQRVRIAIEGLKYDLEDIMIEAMKNELNIPLDKKTKRYEIISYVEPPTLNECHKELGEYNKIYR